MNQFCREIKLSSKMFPNIDFSQWETEGYDWIKFHKILQPHQLNNDSLFEYLKLHNLCSMWIELFYTPSFDDGVIHADNSTGDEWTKIYFQFGAKGSTMRWWESSKITEVSTASGHGGDRTKYHNHGQVLIAEKENSTILFEKDLSTPHLVNVGKLHSSHNPTNEKRFALTLALHDLDGNRVLWEDAIKRLSEDLI